MSQSIILDLFGKSTRMKVMDHLLEFPLNGFTPGELVGILGMSRTTIFKELAELGKLGMVKETGSKGRSTVFTANLESPLARMLLQSVHLWSGRIADEQMAASMTRKAAATLLDTIESLQSREAMLEQELVLTRKKIRAIRGS